MSKDRLSVDIDIGSRFENIDLVDLIAEGVLKHVGLDETGVERMGLAVREAVANGVQHGNREDPAKRVVISFVFEKGELTVRISDEGEGFDLESLPDPLDPENLFKPRGRGILLMNSFMDGVDFEFNPNGGTAVTLRKKVSPEGTDEKEDVG